MLEAVPYTRLDINNVRSRAEVILPTRLTCLQVLVRDTTDLIATPGWLESAMIFRAEEAFMRSDEEVAEIDNALMEILRRRFRSNSFPVTKEIEGPIAHERAHYGKTRELRPELAHMESPIEVTVHRTFPMGRESHELNALLDSPKSIRAGLKPFEDVEVTLAPRVLSSMDVIRVQFILKQMHEDGELGANVRREVMQLSRGKLVNQGDNEVGTIDLSELMRYVKKKKK